MRIALLGDLAFLGKYDLEKTTVFSRLDYVKELLSKYDYVIGNLESPLTTRRRTLVCKSVHLKSSPRNIEVLKYLGVTNVSLANNHVFDFGRKGIEETIRVLEDRGIQWFGFDNRYISLKKENDRVNCSAFCSYSTNGVGLGSKRKVNQLSNENVNRQLIIDENDNAQSLFLVHWGEEHTHYPLQSTIEIAHSILRKREGLIICGSHPHCIQGIETMNFGYVAYSLGNFIFDDVFSIDHKFSVRQTIDNRKTFIWDLEIKDGRILSQHPVFIFDDEKGLIEKDFSADMEKYNKRILEYSSSCYQQLREEEIRKNSLEKLGRKDVRWLATRLNYYSIGAKILSYSNHKKYIKEIRDFSNG